jgi:hypothetical protein
MSSKNNNQLNIPEAREAMDQFKMEAARDFGVLSTSKSRTANITGLQPVTILGWLLR